MKKTSTVRVNGNMIFKGHKLTIGLDLGDRWSYYCVLDEAGEVLLEQKVATTPEGMKHCRRIVIDSVRSWSYAPQRNAYLSVMGEQNS